MPLGINIRHSNRSQQALDNSLNQAQRGQQAPVNNPPSASPFLPGDEDNVYNPRNSLPPPSYANPHGELHSYIPADNNQGGDIRAYQESADRPSRSQSHRLSTGYPPIQPPSSVGELRGSVDDQVLTDYSRPYSTAQLHKPQPPLPVEQKKSKSSRFFGFSKSRGTAEPPPQPDQQSSHNNLGGLGRRISIRHRDSPPGPQVQGQGTSGERPPQIAGWQSGQSSESHLESPHEADEERTAGELYIIQRSEQDLDRAPESGQHQFQNPTIRLPGNDQESTIRLVDENWQRQYQQPPQLLTQQPWIAQQNHQATNSPVPISPVSQQQNDYQQPNQHIGQYQTHPIPSQQPPLNSQVRSSTNPETVSQLSHDSPIEIPEDQRPVSVHSNKYISHPQAEYPARTTSITNPQAAQPIPQQSTMPPPPSTSQLQGRRSTDTKQALQQDGRTGPPPSYTQQQSFGPNSGNQGSSSTSSNQTSGSQQGSTYRGSSLQREYSQAGSGADQGRSTPPLSSERDRELTEMDKLVIKYKKVKGLYFEKLAQVEQLQNTLANQRLSQSRTSLDDNEYLTRFNRLDGAIKEIAFSIRKDWKTIPKWLVPYVNQDAQKTGTKEMTAVGRAAISRWIAEEIFYRCFHPALEIGLSSELKRIEQSIRYSAFSVNSQEESDALTSKVVQWKMSTVEGLGYMLNTPDSVDAKAMFTQMSVSNLTAHLIQHLQDPAPQGIEGNATSIVELAVGIACHLPLESRDICITYPLPGDPVQPTFKVEAPLPPLENPGPDPLAEGDTGSTQSEGKDGSGDPDTGKPESMGGKIVKKPNDNKNKMLGSQSSSNGKKAAGSGAGGGETGQDKSKDRGDGSQRVRFAGFVGVEVRGRQWLINPPVWTIS